MSKKSNPSKVMSEDDYNLRRRFHTKVDQIKAQMVNKKTVSVTDVNKYLMTLTDVVDTHDWSTEPAFIRMGDGTRAMNLYHPSFQPLLNVPRISPDDDWRKLMSIPTPRGRRGGGDNKMAHMINGSASAPSTSRVTRARTQSISTGSVLSDSVHSGEGDGMRFKGKIVGLESIQSSDDETVQPSPKRKKPQTRNTRGQESNKKTTDKKTPNKVSKNPKPSESFSSGGKRLNDNPEGQDNSSNLTAEEKRELMLRATEQRLSQTSAASGRRSSTLRPRRAPADLPDDANNGPLKWRVD